jgi:nicotinamidase-related amidase
VAGSQDRSATAPSRDQARGGAALLIIDMINDLNFPEGKAMKRDVARAASTIGKLRAEAAAANVPVIFINDNFGQWHSEKTRLVDHALRPESEGRSVVERLRPEKEDYFVIKPQFSGFYATNLPVLLPKLGVSRLILTGIATDICVMFTAADAHMRDYALWVPKDAVAGTSPERDAWALELMRQSMAAETCSTAELSLATWAAARTGTEEPG